ncbi:MAG: DUF1365 domain-containing protein [Gaiellales bacterium]
MRSCLYVGRLRHERSAPRRNAFSYPVFSFLLDLDEVDGLVERGLFAHNRRGLVELRDSDHFDGPGGLRAGVEAFCATHGLDARGLRIEVLTQLRLFGYVFNPVSFYWCRDAAGVLVCVVAEVHNTFGERHSYLLRPEAPPDPDGRVHMSADKAFHVSPFMGLEGRYLFELDAEPAGLMCVRIDEERRGERFFQAVLAAHRVELDRGSLARTLARRPLQTVQVSALIRLQALHLMAKRVPFQRKPPFEAGRGSVGP